MQRQETENGRNASVVVLSIQPELLPLRPSLECPLSFFERPVYSIQHWSTVSIFSFSSLLPLWSYVSFQGNNELTGLGGAERYQYVNYKISFISNVNHGMGILVYSKHCLVGRAQNGESGLLGSIPSPANDYVWPLAKH